MTVTDVTRAEELRHSLGTAAARQLAATTKTPPQTQDVSPRWLLRVLPWVEVAGGTYRVNRRLTYTIGDGLLTFVNTGANIQVVPQELRELPALRELDEPETLETLADRFVQQEFRPGEVIVEFGHQVEQVVVIAHGKVERLGVGPFGGQAVLGTLADGQYFGEQLLTGEERLWEFTARALTPCTVLSLSRQEYQRIFEQSESLRELVRHDRRPARPHNGKGEAAIEVASGHAGEAVLPGTFVDYEPAPREYHLSVAQTVLRVHSRVADLYSRPMDQVEHQLRLTVEALRERQEDELVNNRDFGLLHNADLKQRIHTRGGPPTPADLDNLLARRRKTQYFLAHPRAIAAFGRECNRRGVCPEDVEFEGTRRAAWRGVPLLPCDKLRISPTGTTSILALRTGEDAEGVIGLRPPQDSELDVRFMGTDDKAILTYLVSTYSSAAVLVPDALGVLGNVEIGRR